MESSGALNEEYIKNPQSIDFREKFSAKLPSAFKMEEYYQTFSDKYGFLEDLSILDLICNKGPESMVYIKNIKQSY